MTLVFQNTLRRTDPALPAIPSAAVTEAVTTHCKTIGDADRPCIIARPGLSILSYRGYKDIRWRGVSL